MSFDPRWGGQSSCRTAVSALLVAPVINGSGAAGMTKLTLDRTTIDFLERHDQDIKDIF